MDRILNISERYLRPGNPFGGSCLPKDTRAIVSLADKKKVDIPLMKGLIASNQAHQKRLHEMVTAHGKKRILIYGLTFKLKTDDIRESPYLLLLKSLHKESYDVKVYDPNLNINALRIEFPEIVRFIEFKESQLLEWCELVIMSRPSIASIIDALGPDKKIINCFDLENHNSDIVINLF